MAQVFSEDRPLFANGPQVPEYNKLANYAYKKDVQDVIESMLAAVFSEKPDEPLDYMVEWLFQEQKRILGQDYTIPGTVVKPPPNRTVMQAYAFKAEVQELLQKMFADLFSERPEDALSFMSNWLKAEKRRRQLAEEHREDVRQ